MTRPRKSTEQLIAEEEQKAAQIRARVAELKARQKTEDRKKDNHRKIVVGAAIIAHVRIDAQFRKVVREALDKAVSEGRHRSVISDLLSEEAFQDAMKAARQAAEEAGAQEVATPRPPQPAKGKPGGDPGQGRRTA